MSQFPSVLNAREEDIQKMLATQTHIGTKNLEPAMERYVWKRRSDGIYIINLQKNLGETCNGRQNYRGY